MRHLPRLHALAPILGLAALIAVGLGPIAAAEAGTCGGGVPCRCGDTVLGTAVLAGDLGVCQGIGLKVKSAAVLDCNGHTITGSNLSGATYGILVDQAVGAEVRNCRVTLFRRGLRLDGGHDNLITANEIFANRYGIELAGASLANVIAANSIHDNRDEGVHVGAGAHDNEIRDNVLARNKREAIYVLLSHGVRVTGNTIANTDRTGIFVKHSHNAYVADNMVGTRIQVRGDGVGNVFENNHLRGNGYLFEAFEEPASVWSYPHDNTVLGGIVENTTACLRFYGAHDNTVEGLWLDRKCAPPTQEPLGGQAATGNVIHTLVLPY